MKYILNSNSQFIRTWGMQSKSTDTQHQQYLYLLTVQLRHTSMYAHTIWLVCILSLIELFLSLEHSPPTALLTTWNSDSQHTHPLILISQPVHHITYDNITLLLCHVLQLSCLCICLLLVYLSHKRQLLQFILMLMCCQLYYLHPDSPVTSSPHDLAPGHHAHYVVPSLPLILQHARNTVTDDVLCCAYVL